MYSKSYRWVAEMNEISEFVGDGFPEHAMMKAAAEFYERIADDFDGGKQEIGAMDKFISGK